MKKRKITSGLSKRDLALPTVGFVMISYNDEAIISECLKSIYEQSYPKDKIYVVVADGGSTDNTLLIIKKYGGKVLERPDLKDKPYKRGEIAAASLKTDLIVAFSADNRLQEKNCLKEMAQVFSDQNIVGAETLRYGYRKSDPLLARYFALIGGADPIAIGLGKADRGPYDSNKWHTFGKAEDKGKYFEVTFEPKPNNIPTLGGNGFIVRRSALETVGGLRNSLHIDACVRLIQGGHNKFAFIKNNHVIHYINMPTIKFIKRRIFWADLYTQKDIKRDYKVFYRHDLPKLIFLILAYITFIQPLVRAIKGYIRKPDFAWFLHVVMCPVFVAGYGYTVLKGIFKRV